MNSRLHLPACFLALAGVSAAAADVETLYRDHCMACHGESRLGGIGPALLPESLERLRKPEAVKVIRDGRVANG